MFPRGRIMRGVASCRDVMVGSNVQYQYCNNIVYLLTRVKRKASEAILKFSDHLS